MIIFCVPKRYAADGTQSHVCSDVESLSRIQNISEFIN